jgi:hypothetical protein
VPSSLTMSSERVSAQLHGVTVSHRQCRQRDDDQGERQDGGAYAAVGPFERSDTLCQGFRVGCHD